jgi:phosphoglucosamine mutase
MKLDDEVELEIERWLDQPLKVVEPNLLGKAKRIEDAVGRYVEYCKSTIPSSVALDNLDIVLDCAHGATYMAAPYVFRELGANVHAIGVEPDGLNINENVGSTKPETLAREVLARGADLGIAFDGDGDRVIMVDHTGQIVDGDELLFIIARHRQKLGLLQGGVVGTLMTNYGAERALRQLDIPFLRAKVGDRYVMEQLLQNRWQLGGENSGHIVCFDKSTTGDAIVSALQVLYAMLDERKSLCELRSTMNKLPQVLVNVRVRERLDPLSHPEISAACRAMEQRFAGTGRLLLRASGTEPLIRVMAEGEDPELVDSVVNELAELVRRVVG